MVINVSNSEIDSYTGCKRKWYLGYVRGLTKKEQKIVGALPLGSRIHGALETYYQSQMDGHPVDLLQAHADLVEADRLELMMLGHDSGDLDNEAELGRIMLEGYLEWVEDEGIDANLEIVAIESRLTYPIIEGRVNLTGKVDMLAKDVTNGNNSVIDFKTATSFDSLLQMAPMSPQLKTYITLNMAMNPEKFDELSSGTYRILKKVKRTARAKPPFYLEHEVRYNKDMLRNHWTHVLGVVEEIADDRDALKDGGNHHLIAPPRVSSECSWKCEFANVCPMLDENAEAAEHYIEEYYEVHDPRGYLEGDPMVDHLKKGGAGA